MSQLISISMSMSVSSFLIISALILLYAVRGDSVKLKHCSIRSCDLNDSSNTHHITTELLNEYPNTMLIGDPFTKNLDECDFYEIGNKLLYFSQKRVTWFTAFRECRRMNGMLLSLEDKQFAKELYQYLARTYPTHDLWWLSGSDIDIEGDFFWYGNGKPVENYHWDKTKPDNKDWGHRGTENCIHIWHYYGPHEMNDALCNSNAYYICEISKPITFKVTIN